MQKMEWTNGKKSSDVALMSQHIAVASEICNEMVAKTHQTSNDAMKSADWEIDTSAPFESVKAAVTLFGEGAFSTGKATLSKPKPPMPPSIEKEVVKETQLQLAQKELHWYKEHLQNVEMTKSQALDELEKARKTTSDLVEKLDSTIKSKESAMQAAEASLLHAKELEAANSANMRNNEILWQKELIETRENYMSTMSKLDWTKQELRRMNEELSMLMHAKVAATREAMDAAQSIEASTGFANELTIKITDSDDSLAHVKHAHMQAMQEEAETVKTFNNKSSEALQQTHNKLEALRKEVNSESDADLETKLTNKMVEIGNMQKQIDLVKTSRFMSTTMSISTDLNEARGTLRDVTEEEEAQRSLLGSLKIELDNVRKELQELEEKEAEAETFSAELHLKLQNAKIELNMALSAEETVKVASGELLSTLKQLSSESEAAKEEADKMRREAEVLKIEAETTRSTLEDVERRLTVALKEAEAAKAAEANAVNEIKLLSEKTNAAHSSTSEHGRNIVISKEEYDSLNSKVNDADNLAGIKIAAMMAQVEAIRASEMESQKKLDSMRKEIEEIEIATEETLKKAEMAEAARNAVEGELKKWREHEQKNQDQFRTQAPINQREDDSVKANIKPPMGMEKSHWQQKAGNNSQKMDKSSTFKKKLLLSSLSTIFHRKKNQAEGGTPSYLPGENIV